MINRTVLMSDALHFRATDAINPYYGTDAVDQQLASREHESIVAALSEAGISVTQVESPSTSQDGVYTANWALVRGDTAVLARLPNVRQSEEDYAEETLTRLGKKVIRVPEGLRFSGQGDALACGNLLFCGNGYRSDEAAQQFAAETLGYERIQLQTVPELDDTGEPVTNAVSGWADSFFYDIDLALAVIREPLEDKKGIIAYCPEAFDLMSQSVLQNLDQVDKIIVTLEEARQAFACNLVSTGETVIMSAHAPKLKAELEALGMRTICPEIIELAKGGGYIRCTSLALD